MATKFSKARLAEIATARDSLMAHSKVEGPSQFTPELAAAVATVAAALCAVLNAPDYVEPDAPAA